MAYPEQDAERVFQTAIIAIAFIIGSAVTLAITGMTVLDSNPASYIIVTMLMGVLFIFFTIKDMSPMPSDDYGIVAAALIFIIYLVFLSYARGSLSFEFLSYRIDALLLPVFLLSIVLAVLGRKGILRFAPVIAYLLFASPVLLMPILTSNGGLSSFSASLVYSMLKATGAQVVQSGLQIIAPSGQAISIASTCVPVGTFVALIMMLVPVSYLYKGRPNRKLAWLVCGAVLFFVLNVIRMTIIALAWAYSGLGAAVAVFHAFGGFLIFCITIIVMLLAYGKFGLELDLGRKWAKRLKAAFSAYDIEENYGRIFTAVVIALAVLFLSLGYLNSPNVSAISFNQPWIPNSAYPALHQSVISRIAASGVEYSYLGSGQGDMYFELGKGSPLNSTYLIVSFYPYLEKGMNLVFYTNSSWPSSYVLKSGITISSLLAESSNSTFSINYFAVPITVNGSSYSANFEAFSIAGVAGTGYCNPSVSSGLQEYLESAIYNLIQLRPQFPDLCYGEKLALT